MARQFGTGTPSNPGQYCRVGSDEPGILAGFSLYAYDGQKRRGRLATHVGHIGSGGMWNDDPSVVEHWLEKAVTAERIADEPMEDDCLSTVAAIIRGQLDSVQQARWCHHHTPLQTRLIRRLNLLAAKSVRARNSRQLRELERALAFVGGGHTAGERMWLEQLAAQSDHSLLIALSRCSPPEPGMPVMYVELLGIVIFDAGS